MAELLNEYQRSRNHGGDAQNVLDKNGMGRRFKEEVPFVLFSMKDEVLFD